MEAQFSFTFSFSGISDILQRPSTEQGERTCVFPVGNNVEDIERKFKKGKGQGETSNCQILDIGTNFDGSQGEDDLSVLSSLSLDSSIQTKLSTLISSDQQRETNSPCVTTRSSNSSFENESSIWRHTKNQQSEEQLRQHPRRETKTEESREPHSESRPSRTMCKTSTILEEPSRTMCKTSTILEESRALSKPKRPLSAYNHFFRLKRKELVNNSNGTITFSSIGKIVGKMWQDANQTDRLMYERLARKDTFRYRREIAAWRECRLQRMKGIKIVPSVSNSLDARQKDKLSTKESTKFSSPRSSVAPKEQSTIPTKNEYQELCYPRDFTKNISPNCGARRVSPIQEAHERHFDNKNLRDIVYSRSRLEHPGYPSDAFLRRAFDPPLRTTLPVQNSPPRPAPDKYKVKYACVRMKQSEVADFMKKISEGSIRL